MAEGVVEEVVEEGEGEEGVGEEEVVCVPRFVTDKGKCVSHAVISLPRLDAISVDPKVPSFRPFVSE